MKKFYCLILVSFTATVLAQGPTSGFEILRIKKQTVKTPDQSGSITKSEPRLDIEFINTLAETNSFDLDVIFIGTINKGNSRHMFVRKLLRFPVALAPLERQSVSANSILWHDTHQEENAAFPAGKNGFSQPEGWIIRASRGGEVVKVEASGAAMRRLADDFEIMAGLESGGSIPAR